MKNINMNVNLNRITWIDIAKGIGIIFVVIAHTVEIGSFTRNFILSFNMPCFFILSGYTHKIVKNYSELSIRLKKYIKALILPSLFISCVVILIQWLSNDNNSLKTLWEISKQMGDSLWWASGVNVRSHSALGMLWFLFSLFWAKIFIDVIYILFPGKNTGHIYIFLGLLGIVLGIQGKWLPQNLDVTFVAMIFIYIGILWKEYSIHINKYKNILFFISIILWLTCLNFSIYIEMATRSYPYLIISIVEAVLASFAICCLCEALASNIKISNITQFIGQHTLLILLIHHIDWSFQFIWQTHSHWLSCILRILLVLSVSLVVYVFNNYALKKLITKYR